ncbi:MAG: hypothetical protein JXA52_09690 [Planctomycetes bacterium]|nr:hypothetical protein [Planctomycetota bacterium]
MRTAQWFLHFSLTSNPTRLKGWTRIILLSLLSVALFPGCGDDEDDSAAQEFEIIKEYQQGPVSFKVKLSRKEITIAEHLRMVLEVTANEEYETKLPEFGEKLEQFGIVDYTLSSPKLQADGRVISSRSYELEPFLSGTYVIPPMQVTFWGKGQDKQHQLASEELSILVKSLLPADAEPAIREIAPPGELPPPGWWLYLLISIGAIIIIILVILAIRRKNKAIAEENARKTAQEIAYEELDALLARELLQQGRIKEFYLGLSNILRHYIENRFALRAPERTTEEFLTELKSASRLEVRHKDLLKEFLQHCDLVKFAALSPLDVEIQKTFDTCKQFIHETGVEDDIEQSNPAGNI